MSIRVGIDTGGTFTDFVAVDQITGQWFRSKVPSEPSDPVRAILCAFEVAGVPLSDVDLLIVGTTVGTNALLERRGAPIVYLTTEGFEDIPFIQRGNRKYLYDVHWKKPLPYVDRAQCAGVRERIDYHGATIVPLDRNAIDLAVGFVANAIREDNVEAVAINLIHSYANSRHEEVLGEALMDRLPGIEVSLSHEVAPVWREYERGITTIADATLKPLIGGFSANLERQLGDRGFTGTCSLLKSNGGTQVANNASKKPIQLLLSGLSGGIMAAETFGFAYCDDLISLDMGGTSCDIAVLIRGEHRRPESYELEFGLPLVFPAMDVTTIGAGGGSVGWVDRGGFLRVGPRSAGAVPGPACYGIGGMEPTVTDANLALGRLDAEYFLGGEATLDAGLAQAALARLGDGLGLSVTEVAQAIIEVADENMAGAIRERTVEVGIDPRGFCLVAFGGAGPLHALSIARRLNMRKVLVPPTPGLCSAFGALTADLRSDFAQTIYARSDSISASDLATTIEHLRTLAYSELSAEGFLGEPRVVARLSLRYAGQNYEHDVDIGSEGLTELSLQEAYARFGQLHEAFYGYQLAGQVLEIVRASVTALVPTTVPIPKWFCGLGTNQPERRSVSFPRAGETDAAIIRRQDLRGGQQLEGPAVIEDFDSTVLLDLGDRLTVLDEGSLAITLE